MPVSLQQSLTIIPNVNLPIWLFTWQFNKIRGRLVASLFKLKKGKQPNWSVDIWYLVNKWCNVKGISKHPCDLEISLTYVAFSKKLSFRISFFQFFLSGPCCIRFKNVSEKKEIWSNGWKLGIHRMQFSSQAMACPVLLQLQQRPVCQVLLCKLGLSRLNILHKEGKNCP